MMQIPVLEIKDIVEKTKSHPNFLSNKSKIANVLENFLDEIPLFTNFESRIKIKNLSDYEFLFDRILPNFEKSNSRLRELIEVKNLTDECLFYVNMKQIGKLLKLKEFVQNGEIVHDEMINSDSESECEYESDRSYKKRIKFFQTSKSV